MRLVRGYQFTEVQRYAKLTNEEFNRRHAGWVWRRPWLTYRIQLLDFWATDTFPAKWEILRRWLELSLLLACAPQRASARPDLRSADNPFYTLIPRLMARVIKGKRPRTLETSRNEIEHIRQFFGIP